MLIIIRTKFHLRITRPYTGDPNSYARPDQVTTKHLHLELAADFTKKVLEGHVILTLVRMDPAADSVLLDSSKLVVVGVREEDTGTDLKWTLDSPSINGEKLRVLLPPGKEVMQNFHLNLYLHQHFHLHLYLHLHFHLHLNLHLYLHLQSDIHLNTFNCTCICTCIVTCTCPFF